MHAALPELERVDLPAASAQGGGDLLVLLAGAYDAPARFIDHGLAADCRAAGFDGALCLLRTDLATVADGRMVAALQHRVIAPARAAGVRRIVLGGISIGAMTVLQHQDAHPGSAGELLLLAPYPGNRTISREIEAAGGLRAWHPGVLPADAGELRAWRTLQQLAGEGATPVWFGFGREDRFAAAQRLMAELLPGERVCELPGGHDWPVWCRLWRQWLADRGRR
ncbi:MAG: hypothetical protein KDG52_20745 [Rhodocyclaceae bacterium]|nr:hypothetical protein [Rhodocyclaceae bacterium]